MTNDCNKYFIAIDPGREKTGLAIFLLTGKVIEHKIIATKNLIQELSLFVERYNITLFVIGSGTSSKDKRKLLQEKFSDIALVVVNEYRSTDEARKLYFKDNPPRGLKRLIPLGMQVPPVPVDDYAAIVIGKKYLQDKK